MINLFQISSNDQSIYYLGQIFGVVGGNVLPVSSASLILGTMFKTFNSVVLTVAVGIVIYVSVVGVMKTAAEGQMLGKEWDSLWVPIRMVVGIAALVPAPSGYSSIQIVIMWVIVQGIGAADTLWTTVLQYSQLMGSPTATVGIPSVGVSNEMQTLFQTLVCQQSAKFNQNSIFSNPPSDSSLSAGDGTYYCYHNPSDPFCPASFDELNITGPQSSIMQVSMPAVSTTGTTNQPSSLMTKNYAYQMGPGGMNGGSGACGFMTFCDDQDACQDTSTTDKAILCSTCKAQKSTLQDTVTLLGQIANLFVNADYTYRKFALPNNKQPVPSGILQYCNAQGIQPDKCCVTYNINIPGLNLPPVDNCAILPADLPLGDNNSADDKTVQRLYWPYMIQPNMGQNGDFIQVVTDNYVSALNDAVASIVTQTASQTTVTDPTLTQSQQTGWILAGALYYYLAQASNKNLEASMPTFTVVGTDPSIDSSNSLSGFRNNYSAASSLTDQIDIQFSGEDSFSMSLPPKLKKLSKIGKGLKSGSGTIMDTFMKDVSGNKAGEVATNPLAKLQHLGYILLIVAQTLFALIMTVLVAITAIGYFDAFVLGTGVNNFVGPTVTTLTIFFGPFFMILIGGLFTIGALLAIYTPLIPYIIFTMGAVAWLILVIEAMVAGPLVALGILSPKGHELLGKSEHALMYLFGIFLRPSLMIFGMIAAMLLSIVVVTMINAGFLGVMGSIYHHPGLLEIFLFLAAYVGLILAALNKCFALIHIIPDRTLRWIGHTGGAQEGQEAAGEATSGVKTAVGGVAEAAGTGTKEHAGKMGEAAKVGEESKKGMEGIEEGQADKKKKGGEKGKPDITSGDEGGGGGKGGPTSGGSGAAGGAEGAAAT